MESEHGKQYTMEKLAEDGRKALAGTVEQDSHSAYVESYQARKKREFAEEQVKKQE